MFVADRRFCSREIVFALRGACCESPVPGDKSQAARHQQVECKRPGRDRRLRPVKTTLQSQRRNDDDCARGSQLKDGPAPRIEIAGATAAHRCSHRPAEGRDRNQCDTQDVMRCRDGHDTRSQHPETQQAAGHRDDIDDWLALATARPFHRGEPRRHCIKDQHAGPSVEVLPSGQARSEGCGHEQQGNRDMPSPSAANGQNAGAQACGTDKNGRAEQTDTGKQQRR